MDSMKETIGLKIETDTACLDQTIDKIKQMTQLLKEAMEIAKSIALIDLDLRINAVVNDKSTELARITTE